MSNDITTTQTMDSKLAYAKALSDSNMLPKQYQRQPANLLWAIEYADSLGLPPMVAITGVHVIEGKPSASAALISALVRRAGHRLRVVGDDTGATAKIVRRDDPDFCFEVTWTMDRARAAGLAGKGVWRSYPAAMLKARAITECARMACEEALSGLHYTPEELGAQVNEEGEVIDVQAEPARQEAPPVKATHRVERVIAQPEPSRWADRDRIRFCAQMSHLGIDYYDVADWCESIGRARPSLMTDQQREKLVGALSNGFRPRFDAWLAERAEALAAESAQEAAESSGTLAEVEAALESSTTTEPPVADAQGELLTEPGVVDAETKCSKCGEWFPRVELKDGVCPGCEVE